MKQKTKTKQEKEKENEKEFIETSFQKVVKTSETCISKGKPIFNTLVILKKDYSVEFVDVCDKGVKEIRDLLPNFEMLCYIYAVECLRINKHTRRKMNVISIGVCKSDYYKRLDIQFANKKVVDRKILNERKDDDVDVLDLWGNLETIRM